MEPVEPKRLRLRVSLRLLMLIVLVAAVWMGDRVNKAREQREAVAYVKKFRGFVTYDWEMANGKRGGRPPAPSWLLRLLGDAYFQEVAQIILINPRPDAYQSVSGDEKFNADRLLSCLSGQSRLEALRFRGIGATNEGLKPLHKLHKLKHLSIWSAQDISDTGICQLDGMKLLSHLEITGSKITDAGLACLAKHPKLEMIRLTGAPVTDAGLEHLKGLRSLKEISLDKTRVTQEAKQRFKASMPNLKSID